MRDNTRERGPAGHPRPSILSGIRLTSQRRSARTTAPLMLDLSVPGCVASSLMVGSRSRRIPSSQTYCTNKFASAAPWPRRAPVTNASPARISIAELPINPRVAIPLPPTWTSFCIMSGHPGKTCYVSYLGRTSRACPTAGLGPHWWNGRNQDLALAVSSRSPVIAPYTVPLADIAQAWNRQHAPGERTVGVPGGVW